MKKLIIVLMMVAMASFLFVGCLSGTTTPATTTTTTTTTTTPTTVAPVITAVAGINLTASAQQYINAAQAAVVIVTGTAPTYSEVKVYVDGITAGTGNTENNGVFSVVIAEADLGADGAKTLYATATETGLAESAKSVEYTFKLDQVKPGIDSIAATADQDFVLALAGLGEASDAVLAVVGPVAGTTSPQIVTGIWTVNVLAVQNILNNVQIISPLGAVVTTYTRADGATFTAGAPIPGVQFTLTALASGNTNTIECVAETPLIAGRATLQFDEDVSLTAANAGTYSIFDVTGNTPITAAGPGVYKESVDTGYWTGPLVALFVRYRTVAFSVNGVADLAGNTLTTAVTDTCVVGAASATGALVP